MRKILMMPGLALGLVLAGCRHGMDRYFSTGGVSYRNEAKVNERLHLPDSSLVIVAPGTTIELARGFGKDNREVSLDGEAWFEIAPGRGHFELHTRDMSVEVLAPGRFHAEAFRARPGEEVDLLDGGVRARKTYHSDTDNEPEVLGAGEMVMINRDIDLMEKEKLNEGELEKLKAAW